MPRVLTPVGGDGSGGGSGGGTGSPSGGIGGGGINVGSFGGGSVGGGGGIGTDIVKAVAGTFGLTGLSAKRQTVNQLRDTVSFVLGGYTGQAANTVARCPGYRVPLGAQIQMIAAAGNSDGCIVSRDSGQAAAGFGEPLPPGVVVEFSANNLAEFYVLLSGATDKVTVRVIQGQ